MKPLDFQKTIQCQFDSLLKKVVRGIASDYRKELNRRSNREVPFCELPEILVERIAVWDSYDTDYTLFQVCGMDIKVHDDRLADALTALNEKNRNDVLMYYFLEMSDTEIAEIEHISRAGVFKNRQRALKLMKNILKSKEESHDV